MIVATGARMQALHPSTLLPNHACTKIAVRIDANGATSLFSIKLDWILRYHVQAHHHQCVFLYMYVCVYVFNFVLVLVHSNKVHTIMMDDMFLSSCAHLG
jgi:hypothetical protein